MAEVVRVLMEIDATMKPLEASLNKVNEEFGVSSKLIKQQEDEITKLIAKEQQLLAERTKVNNPTTVVKYNEEIKKTRAEIDSLSKSIDKAKQEQTGLNTSIDQGTKNAKSLDDGMKKAFSGTVVKAAKKAVEDMGKEVNKLGQTATNNNPFKEIPKASGTAGKSLIQLKREFREQQKELDGLIVGTKEYQQALQRLGETKDEIALLSDQVKTLADDGGKIKAIGGVVQGFAGGFTAAQGAAALFGEENEQIEATLLKVQAALALQQGIEAVLNLGDAFKILNVVIRANPIFTLATVIIAIAGYFVGFDNIMKGLSATFNFLGEVAGAVVDGLIDGALFLIDIYTQYLDLLTFGLFGINDAYKGYVKNVEEAAEAERKRVEAVKKQIEENRKLINELLKTADAYQKNIDAIKKLEEEVVKKYEHEIALAQASGKETEVLEAQKLKAVQQSTEQQIRLIEKKLAAEIRAFNIARENNKLAETIRKNESLTDIGQRTFDEQNAKRRLDSTKSQFAELTDVLDETLREQEILEAQSLKKRQDAWEQYSKEVQSIIKDLQKQLQDIQNEAVQLDINQLSGEDRINADIDNKKRLFNAELDERRKSLKEEGKLTADADDLLNKIRIAKNENFEKERNQLLEKSLLERMQNQIESNNELAELEIQLSELGIITEKKNFDERIKAADDYYTQRINMAIKMGESEDAIRKLELENAIVIKQLKMEQLNAEISANEQLFDEETRHELAMLNLRKASEAEILRFQIAAEKQKLEDLKKYHGDESVEVISQNNKITELEAQQAEVEKEMSKEKTLKILDDIDQILSATIQATNQIISAKLRETDSLIGLQQQRVDEAKDIAETGNAELLELEQKRLDDLNKKKEQFVRAQQALAAIELIANTAIAISKAAAEGGAAAPITIATTLIALVAGLAQARQLASQAAFYKGGLFEGQGYTGDGDPTGESLALGKKPYTYHKREFIFNHQTTDKNLDIFKRIHGGEIDLRDWEKKVALFDMMAFPSFNIPGNIIMPQTPFDQTEMKEIKSLLGNIYTALSNQQPSQFTMDERGFMARLYKFEQHIQTLDLMGR